MSEPTDKFAETLREHKFDVVKHLRRLCTNDTLPVQFRADLLLNLLQYLYPKQGNLVQESPRKKKAEEKKEPDLTKLTDKELEQLQTVAGKLTK